MIFIICVIICVLVGIIASCRDWGFDLTEFFIGGFFGGIIGLVVGVVIWIGCCFFPGSQPEVEAVTTTEIYALADNARYSGHVSGSVFLVQGRVNEDLKYSYMYKTPGKGYGFGEADAKFCFINYTEDVPRVECYDYNYKSAAFRWLFPDIWSDEYIFYIPQGAEVIDDFVIDFE